MTNPTTRERLAALLVTMPEITDTKAAAILGVSRVRVAQLRDDTARDRKRKRAAVKRKQTPAAAMTDADLLAAVIALSGKSARRFAVEDLQRGERTIRRWLAGDTAPTAAVRAKLVRMFEGAAT